MANKFEVKDPRNKIIIVDENYWDDHIIKRHYPQNSSYWENEIKKSLVNPDFIVESTKNKNTEIYYKYLNKIYIRTPVLFRSNDGIVKTSHLAYSCKKGENIIWKK